MSIFKFKYIITYLGQGLPIKVRGAQVTSLGPGKSQGGSPRKMPLTGQPLESLPGYWEWDGIPILTFLLSKGLERTRGGQPAKCCSLTLLWKASREGMQGQGALASTLCG